MRFSAEVCRDNAAASQREWLETNGIGGFASSTITGMNTRRYHGLLVGATEPPAGRVVFLSKMEETLVTPDQRFELSVNQYPGAVYPQGFAFLREFRLAPWPVWVYECGSIQVVKSLFLIHGENTAVIEYAVSGADDGCSLEVRPLTAFRDFHATTHANGELNPEISYATGRVSFAPYAGLPQLHFAHNADEVDQNGSWYYSFEYPAERERGLDFHEDLYQPFTLRFKGCGKATIIASTVPHRSSEAGRLRKQEIRRRTQVVAEHLRANPITAALATAADAFIVSRGDLETVIAGYHWFGDWGRDTMIALPGLTLATGRFATARNILRAFAQHVDMGMLPNRFPDRGETPEYNTVDATLWYFEAIRSYVSYTGDLAFVRDELYPLLKDILDWHIRGTRFGIKADSDGLLGAGEPGVQLTWMDAKVGDWVVTPRHGKSVEIQALWYNALRIVEDFARSLGDESTRRFTHEFAALAKRSFNAQFWNEQETCLYDVVNGPDKDGAIRPNQVLASSLHYPILDDARTRPMLDVVERELLTPFGMRTLSPRDSRYRPVYEGGVMERDSAYHQGTVWPWLLGPYISACVRAGGRSPAARDKAQAQLEAFSAHLTTAGLGQVSEIFDAEAPHTPRGCIAQAWSVAELLRAATEDVLEIAPSRMQAEAA